MVVIKYKCHDVEGYCGYVGEYPSLQKLNTELFEMMLVTNFQVIQEGKKFTLFLKIFCKFEIISK